MNKKILLTCTTIAYDLEKTIEDHIGIKWVYIKLRKNYRGIELFYIILELFELYIKVWKNYWGL